MLSEDKSNRNLNSSHRSLSKLNRRRNQLSSKAILSNIINIKTSHSNELVGSKNNNEYLNHTLRFIPEDFDRKSTKKVAISSLYKKLKTISK